MKDKGDFSQGSVSGAVLKLAIPLFFAQLINVAYSLVDRIYIGHMAVDGKLALTGVGVAFPVVTITTAFTNMCGMGGSPIFSMLRGDKRDREAAEVMGNVCLMLLCFGIMIMVIGYTCKNWILYTFGASDEVFPFANDYLTIYLSGTLFSMFGTAMNQYINGQGFGTIGMLTVVIGACVNIVLDPIFIFVFDMGVKGAAWATVISQFLSAMWALAFLTGKKPMIRLRLSLLSPKLHLIRRIITIGFTPFIMSVTNGMTQILSNSSLQRYGGDDYVTVMTVITSIREIILMAMHGVTHGAQPVISYNYGAKKYGRVGEAIRFISIFLLIYSTLVWAGVSIFPKQLLMLFNNDPSLQTIGPHCIRLFFCMQAAMALQAIGQNTFLALSMARYGLIFSLFRKVVLVIPLILILPGIFVPATDGVFLAEAISDVVGGLASFTCMYFVVYRRVKANQPIPYLEKRRLS